MRITEGQLRQIIRNVLLERGRFSKGPDLDAWLIGLDCKKLEYYGLFDSLPGNEVPRDSRLSVGKYIFKKDKSIMDYIEGKLGKDRIDSVGGEWGDDLPVFICQIVGDIENPTDEKIKSGKISLINELDWMVHDLWHGLVDNPTVFSRINSFEDYDRSFLTTVDSMFYNRVNEEDARIFLSYYGFTSGVGEDDYLPSLTAFSVMRRDISDVDERIFGNRMESYYSFQKFFETLYKFGPVIWENIFKTLRGKVVCLGPVWF